MRVHDAVLLGETQVPVMTDEVSTSQDRRLFGVLVTFRRPKELSAMMLSLAAQDRRLDRLVVVDNDPTAENKEIVREHYPLGDNLEYISSPENLGPAGGIALGMQRVLEFAEDRDWIVLIDDDDPPFSPALFADLERFGESMLARDSLTVAVGCVGARFDRGRLVAMNRISGGWAGNAVAVDVIGGNQFPLYLTAAVRAVGPFSKDLFFGFDDLEYGLRLRRAGFSLYADASLWRESKKVVRQSGLDIQPSLRLPQLNWRRYYELRNLIHILRSFDRTWTAVQVTLVRGLGKPLANLAVSPRASLRHLGMNLKACRDAWSGRMGKTIEPDLEDRYVRPWRNH